MGFGTMLASLVSIVVAIAVVGALAFGFIYLLKLWQERSMAAADQRGSGIGMRFLRALPLGQNERLVLVEVGEEVLLLGVGGNAIALLKQWPIDEVSVTLAPSSDTDPAAGDLAERFRAIPGFRRKQ